MIESRPIFVLCVAWLVLVNAAYYVAVADRYAGELVNLLGAVFGR